MKKILIVILLMLITVCCRHNQTKNTCNEDISISKVENEKTKDIDKYITMNAGREDYFENDNFQMENYLQEVDKESYNNIVYRTDSYIDTTKKLLIKITYIILL